MPSPTFSEQMVTKLQGQLLAMGGLRGFGVGGESAQFESLKTELAYWESRVAREQGTRPRVMQIDLSNACP